VTEVAQLYSRKIVAKQKVFKLKIIVQFTVNKPEITARFKDAFTKEVL
jgi:hypothetical protein